MAANGRTITEASGAGAGTSDAPAPTVAYIVGTYPTITTTFIDREVETLEDLGVPIDIISIRTPDPTVAGSPAYRAIAARTHTLLPTTLGTLFRAHLYLLTHLPLRYLATFCYLVTRRHPGWASRFKTVLHFGEAGLAAFHLRDRRPDHVHSHFLDRATTLALAVGRMLKIPYSVTAHANDIYVNPVLLPEKLTRASFVVTVSEYNKDHLLGVAPGLDPESVTVLHPWVDAERLNPPERRSGTGVLRILSVGRLVEKKGHRYLVEACGLLAARGFDLECTIVGNGPLLAELTDLVERLGLADSVHLVGAKPHEEVRRQAAHADVFVLPCVVAGDGDRDGIPVAIAEAMAMGVPVVTTDIVGMRELVQPGAGELVPPNDASAVAEAVERIAGMDDQARKAMGGRARTIVAREFDLRAGVRALAQLYRSEAGAL